MYGRTCTLIFRAGFDMAIPVAGSSQNPSVQRCSTAHIQQRHISFSSHCLSYLVAYLRKINKYKMIDELSPSLPKESEIFVMY
jgi:hypothetical protein